ncbi:MAG: polyphenol oxidase family protein, partial [Candidatus Muiribacteriaceae bacterium]
MRLIEDSENYTFKIAGYSITHTKKTSDLYARKKSYYSCEQVHGNGIKVIKKDKKSYKDCDGLMTFEKLYNPIVIRTADCMPVFFFHEECDIYGGIHAGRKGTGLQIIQTMIDILKSSDVQLHHIYFYLGPCICEKCYQIDRIQDLHYSLVKENTKQLRKNGITD